MKLNYFCAGQCFPMFTNVFLYKKGLGRYSEGYGVLCRMSWKKEGRERKAMLDKLN